MGPADYLARLGDHKCVMPEYKVMRQSEKFLAIMWVLEKIPEADLYVLQMPLQPDYCVLVDYLKSIGKKVVVEVDDDYRHMPGYNPAKKAARPRMKLKRNEGSWLVLDYCIRRADALTVTTPAIRDSYSEFYDGPIYVLRNFLDWRMWQDVTPVYDQVRPRGRVRVGYLGTLQWHKGDLDEIRPWFSQWLSDNPEVDFVAAGDPGMHDYLAIPERQRVSTDLLAFRHLELADIVATFDIGLVPLKQNKFNQGKSHLKGMEYAGAGIPCIASPTESYNEWWLSGNGGGAGGTGFLAERPQEWILHLDNLANDEQLRHRMGRKARLVAERNSLHNNWRLWEQTYNEILGYYTHSSGSRVDAFGVRI